MARVTGIGGVFFKSPNPDALKSWYVDNLGLPVDDNGYVSFPFREHDHPGRVGFCAWNPFKQDTTYYAPSDKPYMVNYRVDDLAGMIEQLTAAGATMVGEPESFDYGKFAWFMDPDGNKMELWEPTDWMPETQSGKS